MIRVVIADDEPLARLALKTRLAQQPDFELVAEYGDGDCALAGLAALRPDLAFVDVGMPGRSGLEVLRALPRERRPMAILVTAWDNFALQAFDLAALDYLLKPVDEERLDEALERARQAYRWRRPHASAAPPRTWTRSFAVRVGTRTLLVQAADVERIEADGDYATLHVGGKAYLVRERLHLLSMKLDPQQFQRVHRSSIVRLDMVVEWRALTNRDAMLRLSDGSVLRASRTYMPALLEALERQRLPSLPDAATVSRIA